MPQCTFVSSGAKHVSIHHRQYSLCTGPFFVCRLCCSCTVTPEVARQNIARRSILRLNNIATVRFRDQTMIQFRYRKTAHFCTDLFLRSNSDAFLRRSSTLGARDLNFCIKFRGVPNHIRALMCVFLLSTSLYSEFHRSSVARMLPRPLTLISKFLGVGPNFHDFNESKQPCAPRARRSSKKNNNEY